MKEQNQTNSGNIKWHNLTIDRDKLEKMRGHKGMVIWFTGLSGSGKSTLANALNEVLHLDGLSTYVLDGDNIRHGLCKDLGFSDEDREENIRLLDHRILLKYIVLQISMYVKKGILKVYIKKPVWEKLKILPGFPAHTKLLKIQKLLLIQVL